jgi:hypothetical protein
MACGCKKKKTQPSETTQQTPPQTINMSQVQDSKDVVQESTLVNKIIEKINQIGNSEK